MSIPPLLKPNETVQLADLKLIAEIDKLNKEREKLSYDIKYGKTLRALEWVKSLIIPLLISFAPLLILFLNGNLNTISDKQEAKSERLEAKSLNLQTDITLFKMSKDSIERAVNIYRDSLSKLKSLKDSVIYYSKEYIRVKDLYNELLKNFEKRDQLYAQSLKKQDSLNKIIGKLQSEYQRIMDDRMFLASSLKDASITENMSKQSEESARRLYNEEQMLNIRLQHTVDSLLEVIKSVKIKNQ
ncbi:MAG TPA: hypothetical protein VHK91_06090 [Flavisolibacter sp.]|jgi:hypothetical protein|nr:hypothetical protein [Flavisolibacter sp.]